jgi:serine/threonine protein kinase
MLPDGSPYFVMEYVDGQRLDKGCDAAGCGTEERLRVFLEVCEAVEHAHRNLVIHRDLKPSNILLTSDGRPRLLDFGIARIVAESDEDQTDYTRPHNLRLTPEYSSPEQITMRTVTTATDVYSLGAVLYELLTGTRLFDFKDTTPGGMEKMVCEEEPRRPSEVAADTSVARRLRGDLDVIILKALAKEPERRYGTVGALADDIRRHLDGLPVEARPDAASYRLGKFVRRNKVLVGAAALVLVAILAGLGGTMWQAREARLQERLAMEQRDHARQEAGIGISTA